MEVKLLAAIGLHENSITLVNRPTYNNKSIKLHRENGRKQEKGYIK